MNKNRVISVLMLMTAGLQINLSSVSYAQEAKSQEKDSYFAVVNDEIISAEKFFEEFRQGVRETFYHGKVTEKQIDDFRKAITKKLVDRTLLAQEAIKRGLTPNADQVQKK